MRKIERKRLRERKARLLAEAEQMQRDADHWNRLHPNEEPLPDAHDLIAMVKRLPDA